MRILDGAFLDALETLDINVQQMKSGHYSSRCRPVQAAEKKVNSYTYFRIA